MYRYKQKKSLFLLYSLIKIKNKIKLVLEKEVLSHELTNFAHISLINLATGCVKL